MSAEQICDDCGRISEGDETFVSCELCGITLCGDCAVQFVDEKGKVVWHCESCHDEYRASEREDKRT